LSHVFLTRTFGVSDYVFAPCEDMDNAHDRNRRLRSLDAMESDMLAVQLLALGQTQMIPD
jgi:hypothetical protein